MGLIRHLTVCIWLLWAMAVFCKYGTDILYARSAVSGLEAEELEGSAFREQKLNRELIGQLVRLHDGRTQADVSDIIAATMLMEHFEPEKIHREAPLIERFKGKLWEEGKKACRAVWGDLECFPVKAPEVFYENSWMAPRGNSGERRHEGCDVFGSSDQPGRDPVASITDGTVEQAGWLPLGGYRIGIRSPGGGYFYYAHLDSYEREFHKGDRVLAGEILGFMGNTGYGPEGTRGRFAVHLHLGIYIETENHPELSVNPYWVLRYLEAAM